MSAASPFSEAPAYRPVEVLACRGVRLPAYFAAPAEEYQGARQGVALFDRSDRGLLVATGSECKTWLHNLVTNTVRALDDNAGVYAFAVNIKGRVLFDLNILCLPDGLWLDLDAAAIATAAAHFDRYLFTEDVRIEDASGRTARLACGGPGAGGLAARLGVANFAVLPALASVPLAGDGAWLVRHDFAGLPGFELILPRGEAAAWWERMVEFGARPAGYRTLDVLRIEAGIPWLGRDIDDTVLPPETGQTERAISFQKGCYLGQEVLERMRSRGALARRLVQVRLADGEGLALPAPLRRDSEDIGRITSLVRHPVKPVWPGLGYLKTTVTGFADIVAGDPPRSVTICSP